MKSLSKIKLLGIKQEGKPKLSNKALFDAFFESLQEGDTYRLEITKISKIRTLKENNLFHAYVEIAADFFGIDFDICKDLLKKEILGTEKVLIGDYEQEVIKKTSNLTLDEFDKFITNLKEWLLERFDLRLPEAHEIEQYWKERIKNTK
jgi:hypothetical protein